jgi:hypothetical protein
MSPQPQRPMWEKIINKIIGPRDDEPTGESQSGCVAPSRLDSEQQAAYEEICKCLPRSSQTLLQSYISTLSSDSRGENKSNEQKIRKELSDSRLYSKFDQLLRELKHPR